MKRPMSILFENATLTTLKPLFSWGLVPGPACYVIEVSQSNGFAITYTFTITGSLASLPFDLASRAFFVWVKAIDVASAGAAANGGHNVQMMPVAIQFNHFIAAAPMPTWSAMGSATNFLVAIYTNDAFRGIPVWASSLFANRDAETPVDAPLPDGPYYARIRAKRPDGLTWGTEITKSFVVDS
jgi:hypothetical protein